jgi:hypothetical protein
VAGAGYRHSDGRVRGPRSKDRDTQSPRHEYHVDETPVETRAREAHEVSKPCEAVARWHAEKIAPRIIAATGTRRLFVQDVYGRW